VTQLYPSLYSVSTLDRTLRWREIMAICYMDSLHILKPMRDESGNWEESELVLSYITCPPKIMNNRSSSCFRTILVALMY